MRRVPMLLLLLSAFHLGFAFLSVAQDSHTQKLIDGASIEDAQAILLAFSKNILSLKPISFAPAQPGSLTAS